MSRLVMDRAGLAISAHVTERVQNRSGLMLGHYARWVSLFDVTRRHGCIFNSLSRLFHGAQKALHSDYQAQGALRSALLHPKRGV